MIRNGHDDDGDQYVAVTLIKVILLLYCYCFAVYAYASSHRQQEPITEETTESPCR